MQTTSSTRIGLLRNLLLIPRLRAHYGDLFSELSRQAGPVYRMNLPFRMIVANDPRLIHYVLKQNARNYIKSEQYGPLRPILGNGLVTSHGEAWKRSRRTIAPEFHDKAIEGFTEVMVRHTQAVAKQWVREMEDKPELVMDIADAMMSLTLSIVGEVFFGDVLGTKSQQIADNLYTLLDVAVRRTLAIVNPPESWPTPLNRRGRAAREQLDQLVREVIDNRRQQLHDGAVDVLSRLLLARDKETGEAMGEQQLLDEVKTLMLAGHETTSLALSWCWYLLDCHPEAEAKLQEELATVLQGRVPGLDDVFRLQYTRHLILESIRLYPPIPVFSRQPLVDDEFEGVRLPRGITVQLPAYATHRDPRYWDRADEFRPERFDGFRNPPDALVYYPFAAGPRACIGEHFAMTEAVLILASLAQKFRIRRIDRQRKVESEALTTLRPRGGLKVRVERR